MQEYTNQSKTQQEINTLLKGLNPQQVTAVKTRDGKYLVLASAGSGKTLVLTRRIEYLLRTGVEPWNIVGISFTNKAANEIRERLYESVGEVALDLKLGTFHSYCMRILLKHQHLLGMQNITVLDDDEAFKIISDIAQTHGYTSKEGAQEAKQTIDFWGNKGLTPTDVRNGQDMYPEDMIGIYEEYATFKRSVGYVDFNDILLLTHELLSRFPHVQHEVADKNKYFMVDEFQDSNGLQLKLLYQLTSVHNNYVLYMDDLQAIYGFRGGDVEGIIDLVNKDSDITQILLETNYRCSDTIVRASNGMIQANMNQLKKTSIANKEEGSPIFMYESDDETREAEFVAKMIKALIRNKGYKYEDFMVLYRAHSLSRAVEMHFNQEGIPYEIIGGSEFYERSEVKDLVAYLRALDNPLDDLAYERIINRPSRRIGETTVNRIKVYALGAEIPFSKALDYVEDIPKINKPTKQRIGEFNTFIKEGQELIKQDGVTLRQILIYILQKTKYLDQFNKDMSKDIVRLENIQELLNVAVDFDTKDHEALLEDQTVVNQFLTETALYNDPEDEDKRSQVRMLSIHGAKGLEAPVVFVIGLEEGTFPSFRINSQKEMEEERRLFYVAMTRAEDLLFLSNNLTKWVRQEKRVQRRSRFLSEIPEQYVKQLGKAKQMD